MADEISSGLGGTKNPHSDSTTAAADPTVDGAPTSDERPSKRLKTAAHEAHSETNGEAGSPAVAANAATVSAPAAETETSANGTTAAHTEPANGGGEYSSATKATDGGEPAVNTRRPGIAPIKPEYVAPKVLIPMYSLINGYAYQIPDQKAGKDL